MTVSETLPALDDASFRAIAELAHRESGLVLLRRKSSMIQSRLRKRLRHLGLRDFAAYSALVTSNAGLEERKHLISALTTNVSHFFREKYHFDILAEAVARRKTALRQGERLRIWSAGCAMGQEAYSAGMAILNVLPEAAELDIRVLGTDIDPLIIKQAKNGRYPRKSLSEVPAELRSRFFTPAPHDPEQLCLDERRLQRLVTFNELNLLRPWPFKGQIDFIFCRNVVIYFDPPTCEALWPRFANLLTAEGQLFLGHSERIADPQRLGFSCVGPTTYALARTSTQKGTS